MLKMRQVGDPGRDNKKVCETGSRLYKLVIHSRDEKSRYNIVRNKHFCVT